MKKCDEILDLLSLYIDNELDEVSAKMVKEHVEECSSCKSELVQLYEVVKLCNDIDEVELPENFKDDLHQRLTSEKQKLDDGKKILIMRSRIMKTITSVAAVVLVVFAVHGFLNMGINNKKTNFLPESQNSVSWDYSSEKDRNDNGYGSSVQRGAGERPDNQMRVAGTEDNFKLYGENDSQNNTDSKEKVFKGEEDSYNISGETALGITADEQNKSSNASTDLGVTYDISKDPNNGEDTYLQFNRDVDDNNITKSLDPYGKTSEERFVSFNMKSDNIEADKIKIEDIAGKFGTKIEDNIFAFDAKLSVKFNEPTINSMTDYTVSYSVDKSNYDRFIDELDKSFSGKYKVTNDEEQLINKVRDLDDTIAKLEKSNKANMEELNALQEERENILKQLDDKDSSSKIIVTFTISPE
jgi:hypothetical protein